MQILYVLRQSPCFSSTHSTLQSYKVGAIQSHPTVSYHWTDSRKLLPSSTYVINAFGVAQPCPTPGPRAACGPVEGFVRSSLVFAVVKVSCILTTCLCFDFLNLTFLMQEILSAILSRLLLLQLGFEHFQYISLSYI